VDKRFEGDFQAENERLRQKPVLSTRVQGFNINSGRQVDIAAYATGF
jgi:hypothetical protein